MSGFPPGSRPASAAMAEIGHDVLGVYRGLDPAALLDIEPVILDARNNLDLARWRAAG